MRKKLKIVKYRRKYSKNIGDIVETEEILGDPLSLKQGVIVGKRSGYYRILLYDTDKIVARYLVEFNVLESALPPDEEDHSNYQY
jgi:hypothetical protein